MGLRRSFLFVRNIDFMQKTYKLLVAPPLDYSIELSIDSIILQFDGNTNPQHCGRPKNTGALVQVLQDILLHPVHRPILT